MQRPTYFWSGSNHAGEIRALAKHGQAIGVSAPELDKQGRALSVLEGLAVRQRTIVNVQRAQHTRPIIMLGHRRDELPTGDVEVTVDGESFLFGFRKIAVNVARVASDGVNVLGSLLRRMFGDDAGTAGAGHKVAIELTRTGWRMTEAELDAFAVNASPVFVDSGAFGEVRFDEDLGRFVDVEPITDEGWRERLAAYERIAKALGERCYLVAPDKVGDQAETLARLARYAPEVRALRALGANVIVPIQRGAMSPAAFDGECARVLGFDDYVRGIPCRKGAATPEEVAELSSSLPAEARVHLLGLGPWSPKYEAIVEAVGRPAGRVFCDSVRLKAMTGRTNGPGGGPRILTSITDAVRAGFGLPITGRLPAGNAERVKFAALDRYFSAHHGMDGQPETV